MIPLDEVAARIAAMHFDAATIFKLGVALAPIVLSEPEPNGVDYDPPPRRRRPPARTNGAQHANGVKRSRANAPIPLSYDGQTFPSCSKLAAHLAPIMGRSVSTITAILRANHNDVAAVVRRYGANQRPPAARRRPRARQRDDREAAPAGPD